MFNIGSSSRLGVERSYASYLDTMYSDHVWVMFFPPRLSVFGTGMVVGIDGRLYRALKRSLDV